MTQAPHVGLWLLFHPLVVALLGGALSGDMSIALIVAVAVTPLLSERDDPEIGAAVTLAAIFVGLHISQSRAMGGILNESWLGSTLGLVCALVPTFLLAQLHRTAIGRTIKTVATVSMVVVLGHVIRPPAAAWGLAPWAAGGLFLVGMGRLAGSPPDPDRSPRRLATALALAATNVLSGGAVLVLPVVWWVSEAVRSKEPSGRFFQVLAAVGALGAAMVCTWLPYQLPAWDQPMLQMPDGNVVVEIGKTAIVLPLMGIGAALYFGFGRPRSE